MGLPTELSTPWLWSPGPDSDIVLCSRVRLSRNLAELPYPGAADDRSRRLVTERLARAVRSALIADGPPYDGPHGAPFAEFEPRPMDRAAQETLIESYLLDYPLPWRLFAAGPVFAAIGSVDHLRLVAFSSGNTLAPALDRLRRLETYLEAQVQFAVSLDMGYLSTEISNAGTAMRASVLLHLPVMTLSDRIEPFLSTCTDHSVSLSPVFSVPADEQAVSSSSLYLLRNERTLDQSEVETLANLEDQTTALVHYERAARDELVAGSADAVREDVSDTLERLQGAQSLPIIEAVQMLSKVRLGIVLGFLEGVDVATVTSLLFLSRRHHVLNQVAGNDEVVGEDTNTSRARLVRELLVG